MKTTFLVSLTSLWQFCKQFLSFDNVQIVFNAEFIGTEAVYLLNISMYWLVHLNGLKLPLINPVSVGIEKLKVL